MSPPWPNRTTSSASIPSPPRASCSRGTTGLSIVGVTSITHGRRRTAASCATAPLSPTPGSVVLTAEAASLASLSATATPPISALAAPVRCRLYAPMSRTTVDRPRVRAARRKSRGYQPPSASRKPTYPAGLRLARLVHELHLRPRGLGFREIASVLGGVSERTVRRYVRSV